MLEWFIELSAIIQALLATLFTWGVTAVGAAFVFFFKKTNKTFLDGMLGFGAGVMIAASYWSLLAPSIDISEQLGITVWIPPLLGFTSGFIILMLLDIFLKKRMSKYSEEDGKHRSMMLALAITLHNIPEGLAIGVAFGAAAAGIGGATIGVAVALAIGIGLQNFPEGMAVAIPLRREGCSRRKSFFYGQASALVEPVAGVVGAYLVFTMREILPYSLAFAAGAMIYVVIEELIPESQKENTKKLATIGFMVGFAMMMVLDVALG